MKIWYQNNCCDACLNIQVALMVESFQDFSFIQDFEADFP